MSYGDIVKPSQKESSGDNVYDKLRKRLQRHFLGGKKIRLSSMTLRWHSLISLSGERDYGERDGWVERGTRSICESIQSVFPKT